MAKVLVLVSRPEVQLRSRSRDLKKGLDNNTGRRVNGSGIRNGEQKGKGRGKGKASDPTIKSCIRH